MWTERAAKFVAIRQNSERIFMLVPAPSGWLDKSQWTPDAQSVALESLGEKKLLENALDTWNFLNIDRFLSGSLL